MSSTNDEDCVVCCRKVFVYAIGSCDHPVCYECSARMRVLCETNECPICRTDMPVVLFTRKLKTFSSIHKKFTLLNKKYQILFEDESVLKEFELLLEYRCSTCTEVFPNFDKLKDHVRRKHELHYCELCTDNLKIFSFERRSYSRKDLARHKRLGDPDMTSHQGHPLCKFCDQRYVDSDDLFRHLRRDHFFCYFCDADGKNQYYSNYDELRVHFRKDHYLCEEGDCAQERFTSAFRTDIDLKSHRATHHCKNRSDARQTRMLDLEFNYVPLTRPSGSSSPRGGRYGQYRKDRRNADEYETRGQRSYPSEVENIDTQSVQQFPYLSEDGVAANGHSVPETKLNSLTLQSSYNKNPNPYRRNDLSADQFPALGSGKSSNSVVKPPSNSLKSSSSSRGPNSTNQKSFAQNVSAASNDQKAKGAESRSGDNKASKNSKWLSSKSKPAFDEEFPVLAVKKGPSTSASVVTAPSNSNFLNAVKNIKEPEPKPLPEFLMVKSKSKKKKQVTIPIETDQKEKPAVKKVSPAEPESSVASEESTNRFKSHMVHPVLATTSVPYRLSDTWEEKVSFGNADFPPLDAPSAPPKKPPGFKNPKARAPPGFSQPTNVEPRTNKPLTLSAVADILKQSQSKGNKSSSNQNYTYIRPPNFDQRNQDLIIKITTLPNHDNESFQEFKQMSGSFRADHISASVFHNKCLEILGRCAFQDIFAELVTLLPDISKQQDLLAVHYKYLWDKDEGSDYYQIVSCRICNQVLLNRDEKYHGQMHESSQ